MPMSLTWLFILINSNNQYHVSLDKMDVLCQVPSIGQRLLIPSATVKFTCGLGVVFLYRIQYMSIFTNKIRHM